MTKEVEAAQKELRRVQDELAALQQEQEGIRERLKEAAKRAAREGDPTALVEALQRREALPWLVWATEIHKLRMDEALKDARLREMDKEIKVLNEAHLRSPADGALARRLDEAQTQRRMLTIGDHRYAQDLRRLEASAPGA